MTGFAPEQRLFRLEFGEEMTDPADGGESQLIRTLVVRCVDGPPFSFEESDQIGGDLIRIACITEGVESAYLNGRNDSAFRLSYHDKADALRELIRKVRGHISEKQGGIFVGHPADLLPLS